MVLATDPKTHHERSSLPKNTKPLTSFTRKQTLFTKCYRLSCKAILVGERVYTRAGGYEVGIHNIVFWKDPKELMLKVQAKLAGWKANTRLVSWSSLSQISPVCLLTLCLVLNYLFP